jgi:haloalkane dehalogenase
LAIDGHLIHYVDEGVGPMMVFVHAGPAWSFVYRHLTRVPQLVGTRSRELGL